jgi:signal transduction histidine kinase
MVQEVVLEHPDPDRFRVEVGHAATFSADRQLLTIMIDNLVSNARKYSTPGSLISIVINSRDGRTRLSISNDVPPGCLPDQAKLFERFYRHPGVMGIPGSGLGLAVARLSAEKLAAHIESRIEGNQVSFIVDIPA